MSAEWVSVSLALAFSGIGAVVWLVRLEGRVDRGDDRHVALEKSHDELKSDVRYIRERIDDALSK